jgi:prevent-host-death family protein
MTSKKTGSRSSRSSTKPKPQRGSKVRAGKATRASIAEVKDDFSRYLRAAAKEEVIITRHGQPAGVLIGFESEDDWFEYRLERDPTFLAQISQARAALRRGQGVLLENVDD